MKNNIDQNIIELYDKMEIAIEEENLMGLSTGFNDLDNILGGLVGGNIYIISSETSMGKSSLCENIANHVSLSLDKQIAYFPNQFTARQLTAHLVTQEAHINYNRVKTGVLSESEWRRLSTTSGKMGDSKQFINKGIINIESFAEKVEILTDEKDLKVIFIDGLQLIRGFENINNEQLRITKLMREIKNIAIEFELPIVITSQLGTTIKANDKRPRLSYFKNREIIEIANTVLFIYREDYYKPDTEKQGITEIIIAKNEGGSVGTVELAFQKEYRNFVTLSKRD